MAIIRITNLKLHAVIGVYDWERTRKQDVLANITIDFDAAKACQSDAIEDTIDYKALTERIIKEAEASSFFLLEKLAQRIIDMIISDPQAKEVTVRVDKPSALDCADSVSVELNQKQGSVNRAIVGLGSNIEPEKNIRKAKEMLAREHKILAESRFVITEPVGEVQPADFTVSERQNSSIPVSKIDARSAYFVNGAVLLETNLNIDQLKTALKNTELNIGKNGGDTPRSNKPIDLDIVAWNKEIVDQDFHNRDYLKHSVLELIPDLNY